KLKLFLPLIKYGTNRASRYANLLVNQQITATNIRIVHSTNDRKRSIGVDFSQIFCLDEAYCLKIGQINEIKASSARNSAFQGVRDVPDHHFHARRTLKIAILEAVGL